MTVAGQWAVVVGPLIIALGLYISTRNATRERIASQRRDRERELDRAREEGARSRDQEVQRLNAELENERYDRKRAEERSDFYEREYNRLRDKRG